MSEAEILKNLVRQIEGNDFFEGDYDEDDAVACDGCNAPFDGQHVFCGECWSRISAALTEKAERE